MYEFVRESLREPSLQFVLQTHPERTVLDPEASLAEAGLLPASLVNMSCAEGVAAPLLKDELVQQALLL